MIASAQLTRNGSDRLDRYTPPGYARIKESAPYAETGRGRPDALPRAEA
jgi:hypothetical protein